jgi:hypothetical protein
MIWRENEKKNQAGRRVVGGETLRAVPVRAFYGEFALDYGDLPDLDSH